MNQKYRVHEVAKDLNVQSSEVIEVVNEYFGTTKKAQTALSAEELDVVFEKFSQQNQVKSFAPYFASKNAPKKEEKPAEPAEKAPESKPKETPVSAETKPAAAETKPVQKPNFERPSRPVQDRNDRPERQDRPAQKPYNDRQSGSNQQRPYGDRQNSSNQQRPYGDRQNGSNQQRPYGDRQNGSNQQRQYGDRQNGSNQQRQYGDRQNGSNQQRPYGDRRPDNRTNDRKPVSAAPARPVAPVIDTKNIKVNDPPRQKQKGEAVQRGEQVTRTVDTRGTYVELDKYNEKYEKIASSGKINNDNFERKQKITQKSQQNKKRGKFTNTKKRKETETEKLRRLELERARKQQLKVLIPDEIVISELASRLKVTATAVIKKLMAMGEMCTINQVIDFDMAALVADEFGAKVEKEVIVTIEERLFEEVEDNDENLVSRSPVVVVMGHVDHGKTSLLDRIRKANVTAHEAGGITQHIGAYRVKAGDKDITFLDTPGHEAFTSMRARGASITDIAILVVAADDGIMPQTVEAINHAKAAGVSIIVAINKMDKEGANPDRIKQELTEHGLVIEEWGGDVICVPVSAKTGLGFDELLEMISLTADVLDLKANPDRLAKGAVIEARLDKGKGPIATVLVQNGTLRTGDTIIAGTAVGRIRVMRDDMGREVKEAGPSVPVEITGLAEVPSAGDNFAVVEDERLAKELVEKRKYEAKEEQFNLYQKVTLDNLFSQIEQGTVKELPIIIKGDVQGSVEAVRQSLEKLSNDEVHVRMIHGGVGAISESDVMLASASNAIIIGFNVRPIPAAAEQAKREEVDLRFYTVIYDAINEMTTALKGMLAPKYREKAMGRIEVRQVYKISNVGAVAGSYVLDGKVTRQCEIRVVRDGIVIATDKMSSLKRFKDDVKEVAAGYECGITLDKFVDIKEGDIFEAFIMEEYRD